MSEHGYVRTIKSYVVRGGRLTSSQRQAMTELWPKYGLEQKQGMLVRQEIFERSADLVFEVGFGMGDSLIKMAKGNPDQDFIGVDVHPPGIGTLLRQIKENQLSNVRVYQGDATIVLQECIKADELSKIQIFFPDPWHKKKHHKRRLIQPEFVQAMREKLQPGGVMHLATDWENYAEQMMAVMSVAPGFQNSVASREFAHDHSRPSTKFERRGQRLGHGVWDLIFEKVD